MARVMRASPQRRCRGQGAGGAPQQQAEQADHEGDRARDQGAALGHRGQLHAGGAEPEEGQAGPRQHGQLPAQGRAAQTDAVTPVIGEQQQGRDAEAQQRQRLWREFLLGAQTQGEKETGPEQQGGEGGGPAAATG